MATNTKLDPNTVWTGHELGEGDGDAPQGYELFWGTGGHSGPYWGMEDVQRAVWQEWHSGREPEIHVHRRCAEGLGGYWYIGSYRLRRNGEKLWPRPLAEWLIGRDRVWNRKGSKT